MKLLLDSAFVSCFLWILAVPQCAFSQVMPVDPNPLAAKLKCPDRVHDVAFSPDGKLIAAGYGWNEKGGVTIWNATDQSTIATLAVGKDDNYNVEAVEFSPDGKFFTAANWKGDVLLWNVGSWTSFKTIISKQESPESLEFSPDSKRLLFSSEEKVILYDLVSAKSSVIASSSGRTFVGASFSPDNRHAYLFRHDSIEIVDLTNKESVKKWRSDGGFFGDVSRDGKYAVAGGGAIYGRKSVEIFDAADGKRLKDLAQFRSGLFALSISPSGQYFAVAGGDYGGGGDISLWYLNDAQEIGFVSFGDFPINGLAFSPDERFLAAGSGDGYVLLYSVERIRGPQSEKQQTPLCGEIQSVDDRIVAVSLSKVPGTMWQEFDYPWRMEIANPKAVIDFVGLPIRLSDWSLERDSSSDKVRVDKIQSLRTRVGGSVEEMGHIIFGDVMNPGWNEGFIVKIYPDSSYLVSNNQGHCLTFGSLNEFGTDLVTVKRRLIDRGLLSVPSEPLTTGAAHFRTRFIELTFDQKVELRTDAQGSDLPGSRNELGKSEIFSAIFDGETSFLNQLLRKRE